jgi:NTP pyrophosphatase (non-canonical NTP hydrolase)
MAEIERFPLAEMQQEVYENNVAHGWFDRYRAFGDDISLIHSEVSEMFEAYRSGENGVMIPVKILTNSGVEITYNPHSVEAEAADILIRLLDTCQRYGIDLDTAFREKMNYNKTRPYRHGNKVV